MNLKRRTYAFFYQNVDDYLDCKAL
jgi:hypothetical protein